jgi:PLD-like domain
VGDKFVSGNEIVKAIHNALSATKKADFAVAYWGKGAAKRLGLIKAAKRLGLDNAKKKQDRRIICDLWSYNCNPDELEKLLELGFKLKAQDKFHAKVYITTNTVIIGSANASINGLGDEDKEDFELEAAVVSFDKGIIRAAGDWFKKHWDTADQIDKTKLNHFRPLWRQKQRERATANNLLRLLVEEPKVIGGLPVRLVVFENMHTEKEYGAAWTQVKKNWSPEEIREQRYDSSWHPFVLDSSGLPNFQPGDYMVDYWAEETTTTSKFKMYGEGAVWRFKKRKSIEINGKKTKAVLFDLVKEVHNCKVTKKDYNTLKLCVRDYLKRTTIGEFWWMCPLAVCAQAIQRFLAALRNSSALRNVSPLRSSATGRGLRRAAPLLERRTHSVSHRSEPSRMATA